MKVYYHYLAEGSSYMLVRYSFSARPKGLTWSLMNEFIRLVLFLPFAYTHSQSGL